METQEKKRVIGLIGGTAWPSTVDYYKFINEESNRILGGNHTCECLIYSVNLPEYLGLAKEGKVEELVEKQAAVAQKLIDAGAGLIELCSNTMHIQFEELEKRVSVPLVHIVDATAEKAKEMGLTKLGLMGTPITMKEPFYRDRFAKHGIEVVVPDEQYWEEIFRVIEEELTINELKDSSRKYYQEVMDHLEQKGAQGVVLGCTEIPMLIKQTDAKLPVFDTTELHAKKAALWAVGK